MSTIVIYKSRYGATETYARWIAETLGCDAVDAKNVKAEELEGFDVIVYGGGLYAEMIAGISLITKNMKKLTGKKIAVFSTGLTPVDCREYYDKMVIEKNFKMGLPENVRVFNFMGKMILDELTVVHRGAIKALKRLMKGKENPTEMEKLLVELCDADGDFTDRGAIEPLIEYVRD